MSIVNWGKVELTPKTSDKARKQIFQTLLQRTIDENWIGKISRSNREYQKMNVPRVEIRKRLGDANVLMSVGTLVPLAWKNSQTTEVVTMVSMNGTATLTEDDFIEMSLAAAEARGMYNAVIEKDEEDK
jgi:hypothetical protein